MIRSENRDVYRAFGELVRKHRMRLEGMTQEKLGQMSGFSRTSITNIEKGRQHVSLHQVLAIAKALQVPPSVLLPALNESAAEAKVAEKMPAGIDPKLADWAKNILGN